MVCDCEGNLWYIFVMTSLRSLCVASLEFINVATCEFHSVIASSVILLITFVRMKLKYTLFRYILSEWDLQGRTQACRLLASSFVAIVLKCFMHHHSNSFTWKLQKMLNIFRPSRKDRPEKIQWASSINFSTWTLCLGSRSYWTNKTICSITT